MGNDINICNSNRVSFLLGLEPPQKRGPHSSARGTSSDSHAGGSAQCASKCAFPSWGNPHSHTTPERLEVVGEVNAISGKVKEGCTDFQAREGKESFVYGFLIAFCFLLAWLWWRIGEEVQHAPWVPRNQKEVGMG